MSKMPIKADLDKIRELKENSAYTIIGVGGDLREWVEGYQKMLVEARIGKPRKWYVYKSDDLNQAFEISMQPNVTFLSFPLDNLNVNRLSMFRLKEGDCWLDDFVDNRLAEKEETGVHPVMDM